MIIHEGLDIKLIRSVKANPVLYDYNHEKYIDFNAREVAWQKIGDELKSSAADCKEGWINIRDVYRRILRKGLESGQCPKPYKYENEISFLRPYYKDVSIQFEELESDYRSNQGNDDCGEEGAGESDNSDDDLSEFLLKQKPKTKRSKSSAKKKRRRRFAEAIVDPMSTPTFSESAAPTEFNSTDPIDTFLISIGATLKTFSPYHLNLAKSKIFSIVQEHDLRQIVQKEQQSDGSSHDVRVSETGSIYMQYACSKQSLVLEQRSVSIT